MTRPESSAARRAAAGEPSGFPLPPTLSSIAAAALLVAGLAAGQAHALALGPINVQSALGEPLRAEVDVTDISGAEAENLRLAIASAEAFRQAGISYNPALAEVRASLQRRADGRYVVRLAGTRALSDPFVDLLLEASWNSGRIMRDYTLLLDPPSSRPAVAIAQLAPSPGNAAATPPAPSAPSAPPAAADLQPTARTPEAAPEAPPNTAAPVAQLPAARPSPPIAPIAPLTAPRPLPVAPPPPRPTPPTPDASAEAAAPAGDRQITVQRGDTASEIARAHKPAEISLDQMLLALLRANPDAFIGGNVNRIRSGAVLDLPTAAQAGAMPPAEARQAVIAQSRDFGEYRRRLAENAPTAQVAPADRQATGRLQAKVEDRSAAPPAADRLTIAQGGPARSNEEAVLKAREAREAQARLAELSRNIDDLSKLAAGGAGATPAASSASASAPQATSPTSPAPTVAGSAGLPHASAAEPAQARRFGDSLRENQVVLAALGLVLLLIALLAYRVRERRKARQAGESVFQESEMPLDAFSSVTGGESVDTHSSQAAVSTLSYTPSQLDASDVDPVAEADVYLAYGRDMQAEEILREALRLNPGRTAIHLKLLEIHAKRRDLRAYETLAQDVREITRGTGPDWQRVTEMGRDIDPGHPLYGDGPVPASTGTPGGRASTFTPTVAPLDFDLDLDDEPPPPAASLPTATAPIASLPPLPALDTAFTTAPKPTGDASLLDFDLGPLSEAPAPHAPDKGIGGTGNVEGIDRLGDAFDADGESPHAIKLALARELQVLGDAEGARSLAQEVAIDGPDDLQAEAVRLLSQLR